MQYNITCPVMLYKLDEKIKLNTMSDCENFSNQQTFLIYSFFRFSVSNVRFEHTKKRSIDQGFCDVITWFFWSDNIIVYNYTVPSVFYWRRSRFRFELGQNNRVKCQWKQQSWQMRKVYIMIIGFCFWFSLSLTQSHYRCMLRGGCELRVLLSPYLGRYFLRPAA